jgi:hypothetical protein
MARGWESKSVELQIASAEDRRPRGSHTDITPEQQRLEHDKNVLMLSIVRLEREIVQSTHPRFRTMLENALADQRQKLSDLNGPALPS